MQILNSYKDGQNPGGGGGAAPPKKGAGGLVPPLGEERQSLNIR